MIGVAVSCDQAAAFEPGQPFRQNVAGNALGRVEELGEAALVVQQQVAHHEQGPAVADQVEGAGYRARGTEPPCRRARAPRLCGHAPECTTNLHFAIDSRTMAGTNLHFASL